MQWRTLPSVGLFVAVAMALAGSSCSMICFGFGAVVDAQSPDTTTVSALQIEKVKAGAELRVILKNGTKVSGKYGGTDRISREEYAEKYADFREQNKGELFLPPLGDTVAVALHSERQEKREFLGFDYRYVTVEPEEETPTSIARTNRALVMRTAGDTTSGFLLVSEVGQILDARGNVVEMESLERLATAGQVPVYTAIALEDSLRRRLISIHEVDEIVGPKRKTAKYTGLFLGAGIDLVILALILSFDFELDFSEAKE